MTKGRGIDTYQRRFWMPAEDDLLRREYPTRPPRELLATFHRSLSAIYGRAQKLGVGKDPATIRSMGQIYAQHPRSVAQRFSKGHVPANKGLRRPGYFRGRMRETQFKKHEMPRTWLPVGTLVRVRGGHADGYYKRKIAESRGPGLSRFGWKMEHVRIWEEKHGPVPRGHIVVFKDRDRTHLTLKNLELITRVENMRRNTIHARRTPEQKRAIYALIALKRKISKLEGKWQTTSKKSEKSCSKRSGVWPRRKTRWRSTGQRRSPASRRQSSIRRRRKSGQ